MKKWLCLLLAGVLSFSLAACSRGQNTDPSDTVTESGSSTENTEPTSPNQSAADNEAVFTKVYGAYTYTITGTQATDKILTITDKASGKAIQTLRFIGNEWFTEDLLYLVDVTFDGNLDILIPYQRPASAAYFQAYVWWESENQFVYAPQFENLPNFIIDKENNRILSTHTAGQTTSYSISYYDAETKDFRPSHSIYWEPDASNHKMHFVEQQYKNGDTITVKDCLVAKISGIDMNKSDPQVAEYFASNSFWDLDNGKWKDQFYKPSQSGATENPYAIREITDDRVVAGEKYQTYRDSFISLHFPLGWKCLERWGEDGRFICFQDPALGEKCQLSIYFASAAIYTYNYTRENYMAHFSGYCGYEDVIIDSFAEETIQGFQCTKIAYSYTEENTRFVGTRYDDLIEESRLYHFAITYPAAESKTYEKEFAAIIESVRFLKSNQVDISTLPLEEAYDYALRRSYVVGNSSRYRDIGKLQPETKQVIEIDGKYYQSYVAPNVDIRYVWISKSEFPDNSAALWDWYTVGSSQVYSMDLLGKIDEGRKGGETDKIDPSDMLLLSVLYNNQSFYSDSRQTEITLSTYQKDVWMFAIVDMDADRKNELAVQFDDGNILLLRQTDEILHGYDFGMRGMYRIFKDGTFLWNEDAGNTYGCSKLRFADTGTQTTELWRVKNNGSDGFTFYVGDQQVSEAEFNTINQQYHAEEVIWSTCRRAVF